MIGDGGGWLVACMLLFGLVLGMGEGVIGGVFLGLGFDWLEGGELCVSTVGGSWLDALFACTKFEGGSGGNLKQV